MTLRFRSAVPLAAAVFFLLTIPAALRAQEPADPPSTTTAAEPDESTDIDTSPGADEEDPGEAVDATPEEDPGEDEAQPTLGSDRRDQFPNLNIYLPEGELAIRVRKLIRNVLFEGQVDYNFVDGDISTFLRYKYYARNFTYKVGVFDSLEFDGIDGDTEDFDRTRGGLLLFEYPSDYNNRYFLLTQVDALSFGDVERLDNAQTNVYTKIAYQFGTPFDERLNAIVGESRGRISPVLTAYREIGPQKLGFALALTQGFDSIGGDYSYTKFQGEALKRLDLGDISFVISRLHVGTIIKDEIEHHPDAPPIEQYDVPRYEFFRLGGRDAMRGVDDKVRGSDEIHLTNEYFHPIFRNQDYRTGIFHWNNLFGIAYAGAGAAGFDSDIFIETDRYVVDAGLGFEAGFTVRDYEVYLSAIYAQVVRGPAELEDNSEFRVSARTVR